MYRILDGFNCPKDGSTAFFPHERDCWKFYMCDNGKPIEMTCNPGTYWNQEHSTCSFVVDCGHLVTTTATWFESR